MRDKLTSVRKQNPDKMIEIGTALENRDLRQADALVMRPLTADEIVRVEAIIDLALA